MTTDNETSADAPDLDEEARRWLARLYADRTTAGDRAAFEAWRATSADHRAAFDRANELWSLIGQSDRIEQWNEEVDNRRRGPIPADRSFLRRAAMTRRIAVGGAMAACATLVLFMVSFNWMAAPAPETARFASAIAETKKVRLEDGTMMTLSGASEAVVRLADDLREIDLLRGSAFFDVAGNPDAPMVVAAANTKIRVVGTAFSVRYGPKDVSVAVTEGRVAVFNASPLSLGDITAPLKAGQRVIASLDGDVIKSGDANLEADLAWIEGRFVFDGAQLSDVVNDINRYRVKQIEIADERAANMEITTSFRIDQIEGFLAGLPAAYNVDVTDRLDRTIIRMSG